MEWNKIDSTTITVLHWIGIADLWNYSLPLNYLVKVLFILHSNWNALLMYMDGPKSNEDDIFAQHRRARKVEWWSW